MYVGWLFGIASPDSLVKWRSNATTCDVRMPGEGSNNSPFETPKQTPSGHAVHRRRYSTHGTPAKSSSSNSSSYVVRIASVLLLLWTIAYAIVCFRFVSREEIDIAPEVPIFNNYNPFSSFGQAAGVTNGPKSNRFIKSSSGGSNGDIKGMQEKTTDGPEKMNPPAVKRAVVDGSEGSLVNPFVSDRCKATYSTLKEAASNKDSVSVIIPSRNEVYFVPFSSFTIT